MGSALVRGGDDYVEDPLLEMKFRTLRCWTRDVEVAAEEVRVLR